VKLDREERYELVTFAFKEYEYLREQPGRIVDRTLHLSAFRYPRYERAEAEGLGRLELDIIDIEDCQQEIRKLLQFDVVNAQGGEEVEREIALWEGDLLRANNANLQNWREMLTRLARQTQAQGQEGSPFEELEISEIKKELRMTEVLLYFKRGHSDKTERML
jgi:DNA repair exonuclease SbcCD nuclease subunit